MKPTNISIIKHTVLVRLMEMGFSTYYDYRKEIATQFGGSFIYKDVFYYSGKPELTRACLDPEVVEEFEPYHQEFQTMEQQRLRTQYHVTNYMNQCKTAADVMALIPECLRDKLPVDVGTSVQTVSNELVRVYQEDELFQQLLDRIIILGE